MLADFHFLRPWWWLALIPWALLLIYQWRYFSVSSAWNQIADPALLQWMGRQNDVRKHTTRRWMLIGLIAGLLAITALAGPVWERQPQPVLRASQVQVIVLDLSRSMLVTDQKPSRLEQARFKLEDLSLIHI